MPANTPAKAGTASPLYFSPPAAARVLSASRLELQLQGKLNHPRIVHRLIDHAKGGRLSYVLHAAGAGPAAQEELRVIEQVEELCPEVQPHLLAQEEMLDNGQVSIHKTRAGDRRAGSAPQFTDWSRRKSTGVKPGCNGMYLGRAIRATTRPIRIAHHVRAVTKSTCVPLEIHPRGIGSVHH